MQLPLGAVQASEVRRLAVVGAICAAAWAAWVGVFALTSFVDLVGRGVEASLARRYGVYAIGYAAWLVMAPTLFLVARGQALRRPPPGRLALELVALLSVVLGLLVAYVVFVFAPLRGVPAEVAFVALGLTEWVWDLLLFALVVLAGHLAGATQRVAGATLPPVLTQRIAVRSPDRIEYVDVADVMAGVSQGNYVALICAEREVLYRATTDEALSELAPHGFVRTHRSHFVALRYVIEARPRSDRIRTLRLSNGRTVPVSARYAEAIATALAAQAAGAKPMAEPPPRR